MTKIILSTSNLMGGGPAIIHRPTSSAQKSNTELTSALRANLTAAQQAAVHHNHANGTSNGTSRRRPQYQTWTTQKDSTISAPSLDFTDSGLAEDRSHYEITVKLFLLPDTSASSRCAQTRDAVELVLKELHMPSIDLLIISYPGISFDAEDESEDSSPQTGEDTQVTTSMIETWECLEQLHDEGTIKRLGVAEFGTQRLTGFLRRTRVRPSVNQINVRDCCVVPKPLIVFAKHEKIDLLTHNDYSNILPAGTLQELLGQGEGGAGILADGSGENGLKGDLDAQWVIKYTAVVKDRGVIENKGYFAMAEVKDDL